MKHTGKISWAAVAAVIAATTFVAIMAIIDPVGVFTIVPDGFSRTSWRKVQNGMTQNDVLQVLPPPIEHCVASDTASCYEYWRYSRKTSWTVFYVDYKIFFNERGLVVGKKCKIDCD